MVNIVEDMLTKYTDAELIAYLGKHARELRKGFSIVIDGERPSESLLTLYGKVDMIADVLAAMRKRNEALAALRESL